MFFVTFAAYRAFSHAQNRKLSSIYQQTYGILTGICHCQAYQNNVNFYKSILIHIIILFVKGRFLLCHPQCNWDRCRLKRMIAKNFYELLCIVWHDYDLVLIRKNQNIFIFRTFLYLNHWSATLSAIDLLHFTVTLWG